ARRAGTRLRVPGVRRSWRTAPPPGRSRRARAGQLGEIRAAEGVAMRHPRAVMSQLPGDCPVTWAVLGANALTFAVAFVGGSGLLSLAFYAPELLQRPWTAFTYPLLGVGGIFWLLLGGYVVWLFGGSLEGAWGWRGNTGFLLAVRRTS